jgi:hypothetical protein
MAGEAGCEVAKGNDSAAAAAIYARNAPDCVTAVSILLRRFQPCAFDTTAQMPALWARVSIGMARFKTSLPAANTYLIFSIDIGKLRFDFLVPSI